MCTPEQLHTIMEELLQAAGALYVPLLRSVILFGSYARHEADEESDIDVLLLIDAPRDELASYRRALSEIAGSILCEHGVVASPLMENAAFFERNKALYPFFSNIDQEGIRYAA